MIKSRPLPVGSVGVGRGDPRDTARGCRPVSGSAT